MGFKLRRVAVALVQMTARNPGALETPDHYLQATITPRLQPILRHPAGIPRDRLSPTLSLWFSDIVVSPVDEALFRASTMGTGERVKLIAKLREAWARARTGRCTSADWGRIASAINMGVAIAQLGIASDREAEFDAAADALTSWARRRRSTGSWTLRADEIRALDLALEIHEVQLQYASRGELMTAHDRVIAMENQARALAARGAPQVTHVEDLRDLATA